jgi:hypothetical protein
MCIRFFIFGPVLLSTVPVAVQLTLVLMVSLINDLVLSTVKATVSNSKAEVMESLPLTGSVSAAGDCCPETTVSSTKAEVMKSLLPRSVMGAADVCGPTTITTAVWPQPRSAS